MTEKKLKTKSLALFFTYRISLEKWAKTGLIDREIRLYNELAKHFKKIYFITYGDKKEQEYKHLLADNIEILFNKWKINNLVYSFLIPFLHRKILKNVWVFKTNQLLGSWVAVIAKKIFKKKLVIRQGYQLSLFVKKKFLKIRLARTIERFAYKNADLIITTTDKDFISKNYSIDKDKIGLIYNYIDTEIFKPLAINKNPKRLIFIGRFIKRKNILALIKAVKDLDVKLVLIGKGILKKKIEQRIKDDKIRNVKLLGVIPNDRIPLELNKSQIFIIPSFFEGNPKTPLEAMACRLAVIGTDVKGIREIITHKENGYLCKTNSESIRKAIIELIKNPKLAEKMGKNARKYILENCTLNSVVRKELKLYNSLQKNEK